MRDRNEKYPLPITLNECRKIEAKLIAAGKWDEINVEYTLQMAAQRPLMHAWHASAEQKIEALAAVVRPVVEN